MKNRINRIFWQREKKKISATILRNILNIKKNKTTEDANIKCEVY